MSHSCFSSQSALVFWLNEGVDGVQLSGVERVASVVPSLWTDIRAIVQNGTELQQSKRSELASPGPSPGPGPGPSNWSQ